MIARWPGKIRAGEVSKQVWTLWDFLPTVAAMAGAKSPLRTDGISMLPGLLGRSQPNHEFLYWEFHEGGYAQAVRTGNWKAVRRLNGPIELYDLETDTKESHNLAGKQSTLVKRMAEIMKREHVESEHWPVTPGRPLKDVARLQ
jgi:arylsulfatase A-like enzyme